MKYLTSIFLTLIIMAAFAAPVMAFDTPDQSSDNATDVILWPGGDLGVIITTNGTVSIDGDVSIDGEVSIDGVEDGIDKFFLLLIVALIIALAVWQRESVFYRIIAAPVGIVYGLRLADTDSPGSTPWIAGVVIAIIGTAFIFQPIVEEVIRRYKKKKGGG